MTELQNYRMTDRTKTICPPIFDLGGIKSSIKSIMSTGFQACVNSHDFSLFFLL